MAAGGCVAAPAAALPPVRPPPDAAAGRRAAAVAKLQRAHQNYANETRGVRAEIERLGCHARKYSVDAASTGAQLTPPRSTRAEIAQETLRQLQLAKNPRSLAAPQSPVRMRGSGCVMPVRHPDAQSGRRRDSAAHILPVVASLIRVADDDCGVLSLCGAGALLPSDITLLAEVLRVRRHVHTLDLRDCRPAGAAAGAQLVALVRGAPSVQYVITDGDEDGGGGWQAAVQGAAEANEAAARAAEQEREQHALRADFDAWLSRRHARRRGLLEAEEARRAEWAKAESAARGALYAVATANSRRILKGLWLRQREQERREGAAALERQHQRTRAALRAQSLVAAAATLCFGESVWRRPVEHEEQRARAVLGKVAMGNWCSAVVAERNRLQRERAQRDRVEADELDVREELTSAAMGSACELLDRIARTLAGLERQRKQRRRAESEEAAGRRGILADEVGAWQQIVDKWNFHVQRVTDHHKAQNSAMQDEERRVRNSHASDEAFIRSTVFAGIAAVVLQMQQHADECAQLERSIDEVLNEPCRVSITGEPDLPPPRFFCDESLAHPVQLDGTLSVKVSLPDDWRRRYSRLLAQRDEAEQLRQGLLDQRSQLLGHSERLRQFGFSEAVELIEDDQRQRVLLEQALLLRRAPDAQKAARLKRECWGTHLTCWVEPWRQQRRPVSSIGKRTPSMRALTPAGLTSVVADAQAAFGSSRALSPGVDSSQRNRPLSGTPQLADFGRSASSCEPGRPGEPDESGVQWAVAPEATSGQAQEIGATEVIMVGDDPMHGGSPPGRFQYSLHQQGGVCQCDEALRSLAYHSSFDQDKLTGLLVRSVAVRVEVRSPRLDLSSDWLQAPEGPPPRYVTGGALTRLPVVCLMPYVRVPQSARTLTYGGKGTTPGQELPLFRNVAVHQPQRSKRSGPKVLVASIGGRDADPVDASLLTVEFSRGFDRFDRLSLRLRGTGLEFDGQRVRCDGRIVARVVEGQLRAGSSIDDESPACSHIGFALEKCPIRALRELLQGLRFANHRHDPVLGRREVRVSVYDDHENGSSFAVHVDVAFADLPTELILQNTRVMYHQMLSPGIPEELRACIVSSAPCGTALRVFDQCRLVDPDTDRFSGGYVKVAIGLGYSKGDRLLLLPIDGITLETEDAFLGLRWVAYEGRRIGRLRQVQAARPVAPLLSRVVQAANRKSRARRSSSVASVPAAGGRSSFASPELSPRIDGTATPRTPRDGKPPKGSFDTPVQRQRGRRSDSSAPTSCLAPSPIVSPGSPTPAAGDRVVIPVPPALSVCAPAGDATPVDPVFGPTVKSMRRKSHDADAALQPAGLEPASASPQRRLSDCFNKVLEQVKRQKTDQQFDDQDFQSVYEFRVEFSEDGAASIDAVQAFLRSVAFETTQPEGYKEGIRYVDLTLQVGMAVMKETVDGQTASPAGEDSELELPEIICQQVVVKVAGPIIHTPALKDRKLKYLERSGPQRLAPFDIAPDQDSWDGGWLQIDFATGFKDDEDRCYLVEKDGITLKRREAPADPAEPPRPAGGHGIVQGLFAPTSGPLSPVAQKALSRAAPTAAAVVRIAMGQRHRDRARGIDDRFTQGNETFDVFIDGRDIGVLAVNPRSLGVGFSRKGDVRRRDVLCLLRNILFHNGSSVPSTELRCFTIHSSSGWGGVHYTGTAVEIQEVDDVTQIHLLDTKLTYRQGRSANAPPFCIAPIDRAFLEDPDTSYFDGGHLTVELRGGGSKGDRLELLSRERQLYVIAECVRQRPGAAPAPGSARTRMLSAAKLIPPLQPAPRAPSIAALVREPSSRLGAGAGDAHAQLRFKDPRRYLFSLVEDKPGTHKLVLDDTGDVFAIATYPRAKGLNSGTDLHVQFLRASGTAEGGRGEGEHPPEWLVDLPLVQYVLNCVSYSSSDEKTRTSQRTYQIRVGDGSNPCEGRAKLVFEVAPPMVSQVAASSARQGAGDITIAPGASAPLFPRVQVNAPDAQVLTCGFVTVTIAGPPCASTGQIVCDYKIIGANVKDCFLYSTQNALLACMPSCSADVLRMEFNVATKLNVKQLQMLLRALSLSVATDAAPGRRLITLSACADADPRNASEVCVGVIVPSPPPGRSPSIRPSKRQEEPKESQKDAHGQKELGTPSLLAPPSG
eukprot:TRINITY_DN1693_c0_g3_i1.p1 TRINITY_DN1693_c0_g3~~TRINITY_DN1693_c0_g3_i1.p1  ORF type:complete len:2137 (+),score=557.21 TRINITY_DN1693_c0_g3_i1:67-6477(+)